MAATCLAASLVMVLLEAPDAGEFCCAAENPCLASEPKQQAQCRVLIKQSSTAAALLSWPGMITASQSCALTLRCVQALSPQPYQVQPCWCKQPRPGMLAEPCAVRRLCCHACCTSKVNKQLARTQEPELLRAHQRNFQLPADCKMCQAALQGCNCGWC